MKYCPYCGAGLEEDMCFCPNCGKPFAKGKMNPYVSESRPNENTIAVEAVTVPAKAKKRRKMAALFAAMVLVAVFVGLFASGAFKPKEEPVIPFVDDTDAIAQAAKSVVMLSCYDKDGELYSTGSGFAIFDDGVILTNYHVIEQEVYQIKVQTEGGMSFACSTVLAYDAEKDIAILKSDRETGLTLLPGGNASNLPKGAKVVAIGSPLGLINSVSTGVFSGYVDDEFGSMLQFTAAISHGSSGGALFNDAGEVIGITFASFEDGQNLNMAVPIDDAKALYDYAGTQKQMSIEEFYDTFDHTPPIPTYTVGYVLENCRELVGQMFYVEGYLSSYISGDLLDRRNDWMFLVNNKEDVLDSSIEGSNKFRVMTSFISEANRAEEFLCVQLGPPEGFDNNSLKPGDHLRVLCQLEFKEKFEDGSECPEYRKYVFTPYEITVMEQ